MSDSPAQLSEPMTLMRTKDVKHLADRIEELSNCVAVLEAKLAKAVAGLEKAKTFFQVTHCHAAIDTTLAELKGEDRG